jgi:transcriptional regulator with XRE-family HTH domain
MKMVSPMDLSPLEPDELTQRNPTTLRGMPLLWVKREPFGGWLVAQRKAERLTVRAVAAELRISHSLVVRIEAGDRVGPPPLDLLADLACLYRCDVRRVLHEAGYRLEAPDDLPTVTDDARVAAQFAALILHPLLRPRTLKEDALDYVPLSLKRSFVAFSRNLASQADGAELLAAIKRRVDAAGQEGGEDELLSITTTNPTPSESA